MRLLWRIFFSFLACTILTQAITAWYYTRSLRDFYVKEVGNDLTIRARIWARELEPLLQSSTWAEVDRYFKEFGKLAKTLIT
ncbi:MAG: hypothetical protein ACUVWX_14665, partial [Kiritimatiellia bacterium]